MTCMQETNAGLVGPCTNKAKGKQCHRKWYRWIPQVFKTYRNVDYLSFFCVLIDRKVFNTVGYLDEQYGLGSFEDDDFCIRSKNTGFKLIIDEKPGFGMNLMQQ